MLSIYCVLMVLFIICLIVQYYLLDGFTKLFLSSLIPNLLITIIGIFLSVFVIDKLLERSKYKSDIKIIKEVLGNQYEQFVSGITNEFLYFVLKKPPQFTHDNQLIELNQYIRDIIENTDKYVKNDFVKTPIKILQINPHNLFQPIERSINYSSYCEDHFKRNINILISEFLSRYISILPINVKTSIFIISDKLKANILVTPNQLGLFIDLSSATIDVNAFRKTIQEIAIEIDKLQNLMF